MIIRPLQQSDLPKLKEIHAEYFQSEFDWEELFLNTLSIFVVTDDEHNIICAGSVRPIVEVILITDKSKSVRQRRSALFSVLDASEFVTKRAGFDQLHVFVQDKEWEKRLTNERVGFKPTVGQALVKLL